MTDLTPQNPSPTASKQSAARIPTVPYFSIDQLELTPEQITADQKMLEVWTRIALDPNVKPIDD